MRLARLPELWVEMARQSLNLELYRSSGLTRSAREAGSVPVRLFQLRLMRSILVFPPLHATPNHASTRCLGH